MGDFGSATEAMRISTSLRFRFSPKIRTAATFEFCNTIGQEQPLAETSPGPVRADCVEKVLFQQGPNILRAAEAALPLRGGGPCQTLQKPLLGPVSTPKSFPASEIANALHLRDFRSSTIFEFLNTI